MTGHTAVIAAYAVSLALLLGYALQTWMAGRALQRRRGSGPRGPE